MKQFISFTKKEFKESLATYKFYILIAVFLIIGMISPLFAKIMPDLLKSLTDTEDMQGIIIVLPEPTAMDSWTQFFKNISQIGMIVLVIVFSGIMASEISKGTLINLLTKGLSRRIVIVSKLVSATLLFTLSYILCLAICYGYTAYFWEIGELRYVFISFFAPWLFCEFLIALLIFGGTVFGNIMGSLLSCGAVVIFFSLISIAPNVAKFNPMSLSSGTLSLLTGTAKLSDFLPAIIICFIMTLVLIVASILVFDKKKL